MDPALAAADAAAKDPVNIPTATAPNDMANATKQAIEPPLFEIDYETATAAIGTLLLLHPRPSHANIQALECVLFECFETLQSTQLEEWGFHGLAE